MTRSSPEHSFAESVLISGDNLRSYTASGAVAQGKAVEVSGEYQVTQLASAGAEGHGVAMYDVADGEEVAIAGDNTEVRVEAGTAGATAGNDATIDANGDFVDAGSGDAVWGVFNSGGSDGDTVSLALETETEVDV